MAFSTTFKLSRIQVNKALNRTISCTRTVFILWWYKVGYFRKVASRSKGFGNRLRTSLVKSSTSFSDEWLSLPADDVYMKKNSSAYKLLLKITKQLRLLKLKRQINTYFWCIETNPRSSCEWRKYIYIVIYGKIGHNTSWFIPVHQNSLLTIINQTILIAKQYH